MDVTSLAQAFAGLVRHHIATAAAPLPSSAPGITWIVAANGVFKRGVNAHLDLLICVEEREMPIPGLVPLLPYVRWSNWHSRLSGLFLAPLLNDARQAVAGETILRPIEKQYFFVWRDQTIKLIAPHDQQGTASRLHYSVPGRGIVLCDLHSHHGMPAYFSATDDHDDTGLSVSTVIGQIFTEPEIVCRINVFGHHQQVAPLMIFDELGPFYAAKERLHAVAYA